MKTHFSFGKDGIDVSVPDGFEYQVLRSHTAKALDDWAAEIERALDDPIGCEPLASSRRERRRRRYRFATLRGRRRIR